jgi:PAS domain S-box-containing protein
VTNRSPGPSAADLPDAVVVLDRAAVIRWANPAAERLIGRTLAECLGMSGLDLVHPGDVTLAAASMLSIHGKDTGTPIEVRLATAGGWVLTEVIGAPLPDGDVVLSLRDLTSRRRWEVAGDDTVRFRSLVHDAAGLTMLLTAEGVVQSVSGAISGQLGRDPELVCGQPLLDFVDPGDQDQVAAALECAAREGSSEPLVVEAGLLDQWGDVTPYELSVVSLLDDPTVGGLVVSGHDITRLRAAQARLEEQAASDPLTGLANRRIFDVALDREST